MQEFETMTAMNLGINSDSIQFEVALEKLGDRLQPLMVEIRREREKATPNQAYLDYCSAQLAALSQLQGDLAPADRAIIVKILDGSLIGLG